jgi:hypothetical protein
MAGASAGYEEQEVYELRGVLYKVNQLKSMVRVQRYLTPDQRKVFYKEKNSNLAGSLFSDLKKLICTYSKGFVVSGQPTNGRLEGGAHDVLSHG